MRPPSRSVVFSSVTLPSLPRRPALPPRGGTPPGMQEDLLRENVMTGYFNAFPTTRSTSDCDPGTCDACRRLRRAAPPVQSPGALRARPRVGEAPALRARLAARGGDVGRGGPDPPLPDQGAGRDDLDLPAVLRALHPHGPRRQLDRADREAQ